MGQSRPLYNLYSSFKQILQFFQQIHVKKVNPVYGVGTRTHSLWDMSPTLTTRPGLPPTKKLILTSFNKSLMDGYNYLWTWKDLSMRSRPPCSSLRPWPARWPPGNCQTSDWACDLQCWVTFCFQHHKGCIYAIFTCNVHKTKEPDNQ